MKHKMFGAASLLVIFAVLCLTVLSLLTLSRVKAGWDSSERYAQQTAASLDAEVRAHEILAMLREGKCPDGVTRNGNRYTYTCPVTDSRVLEVTVGMDENGGYTVLAWRQITVVDRKTDGTTAVWDGTMINGEET
ncbi:MAG: hypothetical protein IJY35_10055 [Clostridia bacterium]|nr:hypothetical protein [Clostridia bacterium]